MTFNRHLFSSMTGEWKTPIALFDALWEEFGGFDLDPCGMKEHHYTAHKIYQHGGHFYDGSTPALDGLRQPWYGKVFVNPPYGKAISDWVWRCWSAPTYSDPDCVLVVALLPARTDTRWWHDCVMKADEIRFLKGRLRFGDATQGAPFPSCVVVWRSSAAIAVPEAPAGQGALVL